VQILLGYVLHSSLILTIFFAVHLCSRSLSLSVYNLCASVLLIGLAPIFDCKSFSNGNLNPCLTLNNHV
jgi:hypothetical protein